MYKYAVINDLGKCYEVYATTNCTCDKYHVPISDKNINYLSKYYYPIPQYVDGDFDFTGDWYLDIEHTIKEVAING